MEGRYRGDVGESVHRSEVYGRRIYSIYGCVLDCCDKLIFKSGFDFDIRSLEGPQ